jgi:alpha-beta hydrolase superfamily lysophospholipase
MLFIRIPIQIHSGCYLSGRLYFVYLFFFMGLFHGQAARCQKRAAFLGCIVLQKNQQVIIDSILPFSTFSTLACQKGDAIFSLAGRMITQIEDYQKIASKLREGDKVDCVFHREDKKIETSTIAIAKPLLQSAEMNIEYNWISFRNGYLRSIVYKPLQMLTNTPAVLLIPGYNCGSIENFLASYNGALIRNWVKLGMTVVTIEKSGVGDSYACVPCVEVDLQTDIESFTAGYLYMKLLPNIDTNKLFIWGHSMGGTIAPEIAKVHHPAGVMVYGCVYRPWSEFLLEMHRVQKPLLDGLSFVETEKFIKDITPIYQDFFQKKLSPDQLAKIPAYQKLVHSELEYKKGNNNMWGRHWRFWQQIDSLNLAESWSSVQAPILVLHGGADYIQCSAVEPYLIQQTVNMQHPAKATMHIIPDADHLLMRSKNFEEAVKNFNERKYLEGNFNEEICEIMNAWLLKVM